MFYSSQKTNCIKFPSWNKQDIRYSVIFDWVRSIVGEVASCGNEFTFELQKMFPQFLKWLLIWTLAHCSLAKSLLWYVTDLKLNCRLFSLVIRIYGSTKSPRMTHLPCFREDVWIFQKWTIFATSIIVEIFVLLRAKVSFAHVKNMYHGTIVFRDQLFITCTRTSDSLRF